MLAPVLVTPPASDAVTLDEVKEHLRVTHSDDDAEIDRLIKAAIKHFDGYEGILTRALVTQTWRQPFDAFPAAGEFLRLALGPVASITSVDYYNSANAPTALSSTVYTSGQDARGYYVGLGAGQSWPSAYIRDDAVSITYVAGYGNHYDVPQQIRTAIMFHVRKMFDMADTDTIDKIVNQLTGPVGRFHLA